MTQRKEQDYIFRRLDKKSSPDARDDNDLETSENARMGDSGGLTNRGGIRRLGDFSTFASTSSTVPWVDFHEGIDGNNWLLAGINHGTPELQVAKTTSTSGLWSWSSVLTSASSAWTSVNFETVSWVQHTTTASAELWTVLSNGNTTDSIEYFKDTATAPAKTTALIASGTNYKAKHMMIVGKRLILGNVHNGSNWLSNYMVCSKAGDITDVSVTSTGNSGDIFAADFDITGMSSLPQPRIDPAGMTSMGVVFGPNGCVIVVDSNEEDISIDVPFRWRLLSNKYGNRAKHVLEVDGNVWFYTGARIMFTNGADPIEPKGLESIRPEIQKINNTYANLVNFAHDEKNKLILIGIPYDSSTIVNKVIAYDYVLDRVESIDDIPAGSMAAGLDGSGNPTVYIGDSRQYTLVGNLNDTNYVDWYDTSVSSTSVYYGSGAALNDFIQTGGGSAAWTTDELVGQVAWIVDSEDSYVIVQNTATGFRLSNNVKETLTDTNFFIGYIPFYAKTNHKYLGSKTHMKLPDELVLRYTGQETFTLDTQFIQNWQSGSGETESISKTASVTFPITFPLTFGNPVARTIFSIRKNLATVVENLQLAFKNYTCGEKIDLKGYSLSWLFKRKIR